MLFRQVYSHMKLLDQKKKERDEGFQKKKKKGIVMIIEWKNLFNYLQMISLLKDLNFAWSSYLYDFFTACYYFSNAFDFLFTFDCIIESIFIFLLFLTFRR